MGLVALLRQVKHQMLVARKRSGVDGRTRARLRRAGVDIADETVFVHPDARVAAGVHIGSGTRINRDADLEDGVVVGAEVSVGRGAYLCTRSHEIGSEERRGGAGTHAPVTVGDGAWVGAHAVVLPGVDIAAGCVIAAGAVVTKSTLPNGVYAGVPAVRVRSLS